MRMLILTLGLLAGAFALSACDAGKNHSLCAQLGMCGTEGEGEDGDETDEKEDEKPKEATTQEQQ